MYLPSKRRQSGAGAARLARGLVGNKTLKSLMVRHVCLADPRAVSAFSSALAAHPSLVALSLGHCGLTGEPGGRLVASVIRAHAARREGMVWSAGLRRPLGSVGTTVAAAPAEIARAGCLAVDLGDNRLGDEGVHAVARSLQSDTWLVRADCRCDIGSSDQAYDLHVYGLCTFLASCCSTRKMRKYDICSMFTA